MRCIPWPHFSLVFCLRAAFERELLFSYYWCSLGKCRSVLGQGLLCDSVMRSVSFPGCLTCLLLCRVSLKDEAKLKQELTFLQRWELAENNIIDYPDEAEEVERCQNRTVDDWFEVMSEKRHEDNSVALLRDYIKSFGIMLPKEIKDARDRCEAYHKDCAVRTMHCRLNTWHVTSFLEALPW